MKLKFSIESLCSCLRNLPLHSLQAITAKKAFLIYFCSNQSRSSLAAISVRKNLAEGGCEISICSIHLSRICENFILENGEKQIVLCEMATREVSFELFVSPQDFIYSLKSFYQTPSLTLGLEEGHITIIIIENEEMIVAVNAIHAIA